MAAKKKTVAATPRAPVEKAAAEPAATKTRAPAPGTIAGPGDEAVRKATGRSWAEWFAILDRAGGRERDHKGIVALVERHDPALSGWWQQGITVAYEQARGLRAKHQTPAGYEVSVNRTIAAPLAACFAAWTDPKRRVRWLGDHPLTIRKSTPGKSLRITWEEDGTHVDAMFHPKGDAKTQVSASQRKLPDGDRAAVAKEFWAAALGRLREQLEA